MPATPTDAAESYYPMRVVTRLTGLSSHTIRVWERRHGAVVPERTAGNTRRYSAADVRRLSLLRQATEAGYPIREVARVSDDELARLARSSDAEIVTDDEEPGELDDAFRRIRDTFLRHVVEFDVQGASEALGRAAAFLRPMDLLYQVVVPLLRETGDRWERGEFSVAHEHLVSAQMRFLLDALARQSTPLPGSPRVLIATPPGHAHEFGALIAAHFAAVRGFVPIYLGPDVPGDDLEGSLEHSGAGLVVLGAIRSMDDGELAAFDDLLRRLQRHGEVWVGSPADHALRDRVAGVLYLDRFEDLDLALTRRAVVAG